MLIERGLNFINKNSTLKSQLRESCLCISSYNGTSALETLSANFPTILYWPENLFQIRKDAISYFDYLADVGIYHKNPESAGNHINKIINNLDEWWNQDYVQEARKLFVSKYALTDKKWATYWREELLRQSE